MKKILVLAVILALVFSLVPAVAWADDASPAPTSTETTAPSETPAAPDITSPSPDEASTQPSETPAPAPSIISPEDPTPAPASAPPATWDINKAWKDYNDSLARAKGLSTSTSSPAQQRGLFATVQSGDTNIPQETTGKDGYNIKFKDIVSFEQIGTILTGMQYTMIGSPDTRIYRIEPDDPEAFRQAHADAIEFMEKDRELQLAAIPPNDPRYTDQYALPLMHIPEAWDITKGSDSVLVADIDTGINRSHPDFAGTKIEDGWDLAANDIVTTDRDPKGGHGTAVAGVIAATPNNGQGVAGVCWDVTIVPFQVIRNDNIVSSDVNRAIYMAADMGCKVINMSLGGQGSDPSEQAAINYALSKGCIIVAAAGNDGNGVYEYPASYDGVISAASIDSNSAHSFFSNFNSMVDVAAPGEDIWTTMANGSYGEWRGTSFSSPCVAGVAALAASLKPDITAAEFATLIQTTSTDLGSPGYDNLYGWGSINAYALLSRLVFPRDADLTNISVSTGGLTPAFSTANISYQLDIGIQPSVTVTPIIGSSTAGLLLDGIGTGSTSVSLNFGESRAVNITVTAPNGLTKNYTINITRPSLNGYLADIGHSTGTLSPGFGVYTPAYTLNLDENTYSAVITPVRTNASNYMTIDGRKAASKTISLTPGAHRLVKITTYETSKAKGTRHTYTVNVVRAPSTDANLLSMTLRGGNPNQAFSNGNPQYTVIVPENKGSVSIRLKASSKYASTWIDGRRTSSKTLSVLNGQTKTATVTVKAQAGNTRTFQITFMRPPKIASFAAKPRVGRYPTVQPNVTNLTFTYSLAKTGGTVKLEIQVNGEWKTLLERYDTYGKKVFAWNGTADGAPLAPGLYTARLSATQDGLSATPKTLVFAVK